MREALLKEAASWAATVEELLEPKKSAMQEGAEPQEQEVA
jgi:hypothetical protein